MHKLNVYIMFAFIRLGGLEGKKMIITQNVVVEHSGSASPTTPAASSSSMEVCNDGVVDSGSIASGSNCHI